MIQYDASFSKPLAEPPTTLSHPTKAKNLSTNSLDESVGETLDVLAVQVRGRLVECEDSTVQAERLSQREPDDQGRENLHPRASE